MKNVINKTDLCPRISDNTGGHYRQWNVSSKLKFKTTSQSIWCSQHSMHTYTGGGGVDPIPCVSTHRISNPRSGPAQLLPPHVKQRSHPTGSVHKSQTVSVVGMSGQLKRCNKSWFGSLQSGQFAAGWLAGSILCR